MNESTGIVDPEHDWILAAVGAAAPVTDSDLAQMDLQAGFDDLLHSVLADEMPGRRQRSQKFRKPGRRRPAVPRSAASLAVVAALVGMAGVAAAVTGGALTGLFGGPGATENDLSEYVNMAAPNFPTVVHQLAEQLHAEGLRFAPGVSTSAQIAYAIQTDQAMVKRDGSGVTQVTGIKGRFALLASCTWQRSWLAAFDHHDRSAMNAAVTGMQHLDAVVTTTPTKDGSFTGRIISEVNDNRDQVRLIAAMRHDDASPVQRDVTINCPAVGS
jgi:hypothetical protein